MSKMVWMVKQLFPLRYVSEYGIIEGGKGKYVASWKMWFGKVFNHRIWKVSEVVK